MIVRAWLGRVRATDGDAYIEYLRATGLAEYAATPGNRGVTVLRRDDGAVTEFLLLTRWDSWAAVRAFAGEPVDRAVYYPEDERFLLELPERVTHWFEEE